MKLLLFFILLSLSVAASPEDFTIALGSDSPATDTQLAVNIVGVLQSRGYDLTNPALFFEEVEGRGDYLFIYHGDVVVMGDDSEEIVDAVLAVSPDADIRIMESQAVNPYDLFRDAEVMVKETPPRDTPVEDVIIEPVVEPTIPVEEPENESINVSDASPLEEPTFVRKLLKWLYGLFG